MDCTEFLDRYSEYDDSLIGESETERFRAHMAECPSCARYDRVLRKGRMLARQLPEPDPSPEFVDRLRFRLHSERRRTVSAGLAVTAAMVTVLAASIATIGLLLASPGPASMDLLAAGAPDDVDAPLVSRQAAGLRDPGSASATGLAVAYIAGVPRSARGAPAFPALGSVAPRAWQVERVDRRVASTYSPLVVGPPAYRAPRRPIVPTSTRRTLD